MGRRAWSILALGCLLLVVVDRVYVLNLASYQVHEKYKQTQKYSDDSEGAYSPFLALVSDAEEAIEAHEKILIVLSTLAIAAFTATLWRATDGLFSIAKKQAADMRESLRIAAESSEALKLQTRAMVAAQIPVVGWAGQKLVAYDSDFKVMADPATHGLPPIISKPVVAIRNSGPTKILIFRSRIKWEVAKKLPPEPFYGGMSLTSLIVEDGQTHWFTNEEFITIEKEQMEAIDLGQTHLWIYGFISYGDFLDEGHEMGFCFRWQVSPPRGFVQDGPERYSYHAHEKSYTKIPAEVTRA